MTVARLDREVSGPEATEWAAWYKIYDAARAGRMPDTLEE